MKGKLLILVSCCFFLAVSSLAFAETKTYTARPGGSGSSGYYFSGNVGMAMLADSDLSLTGVAGTADGEFDLGFIITGAVGTTMGENRIEGEVLYQKNDFDNVSGISVSGDVSLLSFMLNGYYEFKTQGNIKPFITGGVGVSKIDGDSNDLGGSDDDTVFAYQLGAGVSFPINDNTTLDCKYRYFGTADPEFDLGGGTMLKAEVGSHNFTAGIRVNF